MPQKRIPGKWFRKGIVSLKSPVVRLGPMILHCRPPQWFSRNALAGWPPMPALRSSRNVLSGAAHPSMPYALPRLRLPSASRCAPADPSWPPTAAKLGSPGLWAIAIYPLHHDALKARTRPRA